MKVEKTEIWITCNASFKGDGRAMRGFFGNVYRNRPEFHGHREDKLIYKHPLIQYKVFGGSALVVGLKGGAYLLKAIPKLEYLEIYHQKHPIVKQNTLTDVSPFGLDGNIIRYSFATPWIGLNEENYKSYLALRKNSEDTHNLLEKILVGNILSMSKSVGYAVKDTVQIKAKLEKKGTIAVKDGVELIAFQGEFETNFFIPDFWGIGKFSSRGYGTIRRNNEGNTQ
ncbi:hypothetical protein M1N53_01890 [Thermodesulfovibrionales bacterium]|nr:hypothetical protein [Thermodesulfovibrionales bacterium]